MKEIALSFIRYTLEGQGEIPHYVSKKEHRWYDKDGIISLLI